MELALQKPELSSRELACYITDHEGYFISESSVYRILRAYDLVTSPAYIVMSAADTFKHKTRRVHELWQTDFTYCKIVGWGLYFLSTVLDDYSRYIISWSLRSSMSAEIWQLPIRPRFRLLKFASLHLTSAYSNIGSSWFVRTA